MKSKKIKGKEHIVFDSRGEFESYFLSKDGIVPPLSSDWRLAKEEDWVQSDDGGVVQILKQASLPHPNDRKNFKNNKGYCRTVVGTFVQNRKTKMDTDFEQHPNRYRFGTSTDAEFQSRRMDRKSLSNKEVLFCNGLVMGKTLQTAFDESFGSHVEWRKKALFLLRRDRIMKRLADSMKDKASELGISVLYILGGLKELAENAQSGSVRYNSFAKLGEYIGMDETDEQKTSSREVYMFNGFSGDKIKEIEAEEIKTLSESNG